MKKSYGSYVCANFLRAVRVQKGEIPRYALWLVFSLTQNHFKSILEGEKKCPQKSSLWRQLWGGGGADTRHIYGLMESPLPHLS